ncbi:magnesium transporter [Echinimonas agarilytica]|uniref:Magnesium transporter MgtE n=1 Tax=Echinimonas agarilytica TaxID=1215918 RepID=A0AA41W4H6_9GAMM|nr:magnesium transporter [Echinimonas agarilytica]MCM2678606.1 magnesium transporter [Echinimonas agarilytica]
MPQILEQEQTHSRLKAVNDALNGGMFVHVRRMLHSLPAYDVALLLESSTPSARPVLWQLIDPDQHGEILEELAEDIKDSIIREMEPEHVAEAIEGMESDDLAYVLGSLPESVFQQVLSSMDEQDRHRVEQALSYEEDSAGAMMNTDVITLRPDVSVDVVLRYLRLRGQLPEGTDKLYVVDKQDKLLGEVSLALLVSSQSELEISEILEVDVAPLSAEQHDSEVAQHFERHDLISAPVVDGNGCLLGRITVDDVVDVIREDAEHSLMSMAGLDDEEDTFAPALKSTKRRSVWLGLNVCAALLAASVSNMFEDILSQLATVAILMTIVPSMGGVAANQTLTLVIRGIALGHVGDSNARWLLGKEALVGFMNGMLWAFTLAAVVTVWKGDWHLGVVIAVAMFVNMLMAGIAGVMVPLTLKRLKIDPALAGSMMVTTFTDIIGLLSFLGTATVMLR